MFLKEFFSVPVNIDQNQKFKDEQPTNFDDDFFWFILDNDRLHKKHFFPISKKIKSLEECGEKEIYEMFMPMVIEGCREYYKDQKLQGKLSKKFPLAMRESICQRLYDHYCENYKLRNRDENI